VTDESVKDVDLYVATGRDKHGVAVETSSDPRPLGALPKDAMREKLRTEAGRTVYKMRKAIVEPVFGQIKEQRGFRRFSLRGKENVSCEWKLVCAVSNLLKLFRAGWVLEMALNSRQRSPFYQKRQRWLAISYQRDYCLHAYIRHPDLKTDESALANAMTDRHLASPVSRT